MSNNEVGKPSNLEMAIETAEYGTQKVNSLQHHQSCLLFCSFYCIANDIANSFAALELNLGWNAFSLHYWTFLVRYWIFNPSHTLARKAGIFR